MGRSYLIERRGKCWVWWHLPEIPARSGLKKLDSKFKSSLGLCCKTLETGQGKGKRGKESIRKEEKEGGRERKKERKPNESEHLNINCKDPTWTSVGK